MKVVISILLLFVCSIAFSQKQMNEDLRKYYSHTNKAEINIIEKNYQQAMVEYEKAFASWGEPFAVDYYNAAVCGVFCDKFDKTKYYLEKVLTLGYSFSNVKKEKVFRPFFKSKFGKSLEKEKPIMKIQDEEYREIIQNLYHYDQVIRQKYDYVSNKTYEKYFVRQQYIIDSLNLAVFEMLIKERGFPSESKIGVDSESLNFPAYDILLDHSIMLQHRKPELRFLKSFPNLMPYIEIALYDGSINNKIAFKHFNFFAEETKYSKLYNSYVLSKIIYQKDGKYNVSADVTNAKWRKYIIDKETELKNDSILETLGMDKIENIQRKTLFSEKDKTGFIFDQYCGKEVIFLDDSIIYKNLIKMTTPVEQ